MPDHSWVICSVTVCSVQTSAGSLCLSRAVSLYMYTCAHMHARLHTHTLVSFTSAPLVGHQSRLAVCLRCVAYHYCMSLPAGLLLSVVTCAHRHTQEGNPTINLHKYRCRGSVKMIALCRSNMGYFYRYSYYSYWFPANVCHC